MLYCFGSELKHVVIPASVTEIGDESIFSSPFCAVEFHGMTTTFGKNVFYMMGSVIAPSGSDAQKQAEKMGVRFVSSDDLIPLTDIRLSSDTLRVSVGGEAWITLIDGQPVYNGSRRQ